MASFNKVLTCKDVGFSVGYAKVDPGSGWWPKLSDWRPKIYDETGGTDSGYVRGRTMTDGLASVNVIVLALYVHALVSMFV